MWVSNLSPVVRLSNVQKSFGSVRALSGVDLSIFSGEVHALLGENGAGKSTLMKILSGTYPFPSYEGQLIFKGQPVQFRGPDDASKAGVAIIHQELSSFLHLTVAENMFVGFWPKSSGLVSWKQMNLEAKRWLDLVGADFSPSSKMNELSTGNQQLVEIAKAVSRGTEIIVFDEPTSSLTPKETERLFKIIQNLRSEGKAVVYISHRMEEIFAIGDRATVLRDGQSVYTSSLKETDEKTLITHMVGRSLDRLFPPKTNVPADEVVFQAKDFTAFNKESKKVFGPLNFSLRKGEVLGFSGLLGSGRSEIMQALMGHEEFSQAGYLYVRGERQTFSNPLQAHQHGLVMISEDRKLDSIFPSRTLDENTSAIRLALKGLLYNLDPMSETERSEKDLKSLRTRYSDLGQSIEELSGGNQQKIVFSRAFQVSPDVLILDEPTRGVDVGAKFEIYQILLDYVATGKSVILISSDLPELMALSDRIVVLFGRKQKGQLERSEFSQTKIMEMSLARS